MFDTISLIDTMYYYLIHSKRRSNPSHTKESHQSIRRANLYARLGLATHEDVCFPWTFPKGIPGPSDPPTKLMPLTYVLMSSEFVLISCGH